MNPMCFSQTSPYYLRPRVKFQKEALLETTISSERQTPSFNHTAAQNSRPTLRKLESLLIDGHIGVNRKQLPIKYDGDSLQNDNLDYDDHLIINPLGALNSKVRLSKDGNKSGIHSSDSVENHKSVRIKTECATQGTYETCDSPKEIHNLAWYKCALNDYRCLGFDFLGEKASEVAVSFRGHLKKNYL